MQWYIPVSVLARKFTNISAESIARKKQVTNRTRT